MFILNISVEQTKFQYNGGSISNRSHSQLTFMTVAKRGETIHRNYSASQFNGHDSVQDSFSPSFDTVWFTQVQIKVVN